MKRVTVPICAALVFSALNADVLAQGLIGVGQNMGDYEDFDDDLPLTFTVWAGAGWDSNSNTSDTDKVDSGFVSGGVGALYGAGDRRTQFNFGGSFESIYYFDNAPGFDSEFYNARLSFDLVHRATSRLTIVDDASISYEIEPDYLIGASTSRRSDQYLYYYNRMAVAYAWSRRVSTVTAHTINGINYDSFASGRTEDRVSNIFSQQARYAFSRQTTLTAEYRYQFTNFDHISRDITSNYALIGLDHYFTTTTTGSVAAGAQFYDDEFSGTDTAPYAEAALNIALEEDTTLRWANRLGYETNELSGFNRRYGYRTGVSADHRITPYLTGIAGVSYTYSEFDGSASTSDVTEDSIGVNLGLSWQVLANTDVDLNYYYTDYSSDTSSRDYQRHRVSLGLLSTF